MAENEALPQATLRETIEAAVEEHVPDEAVPVEKTVEAAPEVEKVVTDDRPRGPDGKFIPKAEAEPKAAAVEIAPPVQRPKPPSSWKKDYHADFEKIDPRVAEYINQREGEYAKGVSTYKSEYDRLAPIGEAIAPFLPDLQQNNIEPGQWIRQLGTAHQLLVKGSPEQKLSMFVKLAQDYQVPLQALFTQGEDGKVYLNPQVLPYQPQIQQPDIQRMIQQEVQGLVVKQSIESFVNEKDSAGNPAYPHYETVKATMAQLLDAGLAEDLKSAYEVALQHPRHADIAAELRQQREAADAAAKAKAAAEAAARARRSAVSPRTATPAGKGTGDKKGIRSHIEAAFEQHADGRV